ncbi:hypothetical protein [Streptosporangium sp. NPDC087985]
MARSSRSAPPPATSASEALPEDPDDLVIHRAAIERMLDGTHGR